MKKAIITISTITLAVLSLVVLTSKKELKEDEKKLVSNTDGMISYTIDGEIAKEQPSKDSGYIVSKIECKNGSVLVWDNDNSQVELVDIKGSDRCMVDFTKDTTRQGYRVTVTSNSPSSLDSLSKTTTSGGIVTIYPKESTISSVTGCDGEVLDNKVVVRNVTENQTCNIIVKITLSDAILSKYETITERTDFRNIETETKLWKTTDYDVNGNFTGTSYYYTGNPNNWVSFAGYLWRIVRINGDNSVRLLYAGSGEKDGYLKPEDITNATQTNMTSEGIVYQTAIAPMFTGWKYGTVDSLDANRTNENKSTIYQVVENWYKNNIVNAGLENYISKTAMYCTDRDLLGGSVYEVGSSSSMYYMSYGRLVYSKSPSLECNNKSDQFKEGFGLIMADEIAFAGGVNNKSNENAYYYLNKNKESITGENRWYTMSPYEKSRGFSIEGSNNPGSLLYNASVYGGVIRPVISITPLAVFKEGDGTSTNPYKVTMP